MAQDGMLILEHVEAKDFKTNFIRGTDGMACEFKVSFIAQDADQVATMKAFLDFIRAGYKHGGTVSWKVGAVTRMGLDGAVTPLAPTTEPKGPLTPMAGGKRRGRPPGAKAKTEPMEGMKEDGQVATVPTEAEAPKPAPKQDPEQAAEERRQRVLAEEALAKKDAGARPANMPFPPKGKRVLKVMKPEEYNKAMRHMERIGSPNFKFVLQSKGLMDAAEAHPEEIPLDWWAENAGEIKTLPDGSKVDTTTGQILDKDDELPF